MKRSTIGAAIIASLVILGGPATAHEQRAVGPVSTVAGWINEPAFAGSVNGVSFRATQAGRGIAGAALTVDVSFDGAPQPLTLTLEPAFNDVGHYTAALIPTRPGAYTFRITGKLSGRDFDQTYTAGETTFAEVEATGDVEYPEKDPGRDELALLAETQGDRIAALQVASAKARDAADLAKIVAIVALLFGAAGLVLGLRRGRARG